MPLIKVLCVEDDEDDYELLKDLLHSISSTSDNVFFLERANSAELARAYSAVGNYDLFLVDHQLEGIGTGGEFVGHLQTEHPGAPAILLTGLDNLQLQSELLDELASGKVSFMRKSEVSTESLGSLIQRVLGRKVRLLVIDDDSEDFELLRAMLQMSPEYRFQVDWAESLDAGRALLERYEYDGIIIDYHLGHDTGIQLAREVIEHHADKPVLLVTGHNDISMDDEALRVLKHDRLRFLSKHQFDTERLVETFEQIGHWRAEH